MRSGESGGGGEADRFGEGVIGRVEVEVSRRLQQLARRAEVKRDLRRARRARVGDRRRNQLREVVHAVVLEAVRAERVREDDFGAGLDIGAMHGRDRRRVFDVPVARILADGQPRRLNHRPKPTVKKDCALSIFVIHDFSSTSQMAVTDLVGTSDRDSVSATPIFRVASSFSRISRLSASGISP